MALAACETTPNPFPNGPGFYETQIDNSRQQITYLVPNGVPQARAEQMLMLRAADNTLTKGHSWFRIVSRSSDVERRGGGPTLSLGTGTGTVTGNTAIGVGLGTSFNLGGGPKPILRLEIIMGDGPAPQTADAYDARDVHQTISGQL